MTNFSKDMPRRGLLKSGAAALLGAMAAPVFAHTKVTPDMAMMPIDTRNDRGGWEKPQVKPVRMKNVVIGEGMPKLIASTTAKTPQEFLEQIKFYATVPGLHCVDVRPDYLPEMSGKEFAKLSQQAYDLAGDLVIELSFRDKLEGGGRQVDDQWYGRFWGEFFDNGGKGDFIDYEMFRDIGIIRSLMKRAHDSGMLVMISDHEFGWTPTEDDLLRRLIRMDNEGSDILKLATWANDFEAALRLCGATWKYRNYYGNKPMCTMAMGPVGCLSRVIGEFTGNDLTFVIAGSKGSAPGQFPIQDAQIIMEKLHNTKTMKASQTRTDR